MNLVYCIFKLNNNYSGKCYIEAVFFNEKSCCWERLLEPATDKRVPVEVKIKISVEQSDSEEIPSEILGEILNYI